MPTNASSPSFIAAIQQAAKSAGLTVLSVQPGTDFLGEPTNRFALALSPSASPVHTLHLELSHGFDGDRQEMQEGVRHYLAEVALRLQNPRPDCYVTLGGLPIRFADFAWPFHRSTSGADTYVVHGMAHLEDGAQSPLHAKVAASMTVTFADIIAAPEQPYAEKFIYNAVRKTLDQGQLELLKSGNRQPVTVTTRYYSRWQKKFIFTDTTDEGRAEYLTLKLYWLSGVLGGGAAIWIADPADAQYLNTSTEELQAIADKLAADGLAAKASDGRFASATPRLMERSAHFHALMDAALAVTKPTFNEEMRHGHTNM
jgi:hypothetical protein